MEPLRFSDILRATGGEPVGPVRGDPAFPAVTTDSRTIERGSLFVPIRGKKQDGHQFLEQAFLAGAGFALASKDADLPRVQRHGGPLQAARQLVVGHVVDERGCLGHGQFRSPLSTTAERTLLVN